MKPLTFYFDYLSPYAYFAWGRIEDFCRNHNTELIAKPVVFGKLLDRWGHLGPAEIAPKREWLIKYCLFYAETNNLPLTFPKNHPFNSLPALRASLKEVSGDHQHDLISAIFEAGWGRGADIGQVEVIAEIADGVGLDRDNVVGAISSPEVKSLLKDNTDEAITQGVFGIPTMIYNNELFWGNDQFDYLSQIINGTYKVDEVLFRDILARPRAIDRK